MNSFHPLDRLIDNKSLQLMEALIPFVDLPMKKMLVIFIKYLEIKELLQALSDIEKLERCGFIINPASEDNFIDILLNFLPPEIGNELKNTEQMLNMLKFMDADNPSTYMNNEKEAKVNTTASNSNSLYENIMSILDDYDNERI